MSERTSSKKMYDSRASRVEAENYQFMGLIEDIAGASGVSGSLYGKIQEPSMNSDPTITDKIEASRSLMKSIDFGGGSQNPVSEERIIAAPKPPIMSKMKTLDQYQTERPLPNHDLTGEFPKNFGDDFLGSDNQRLQSVRQRSHDPYHTVLAKNVPLRIQVETGS